MAKAKSKTAEAEAITPDTPLGAAPVNLQTYLAAHASEVQQRVFNNASAYVRQVGPSVGASMPPPLTPEPAALRNHLQNRIDYYQSYLNTFSGRPVGGPDDRGH